MIRGAVGVVAGLVLISSLPISIGAWFVAGGLGVLAGFILGHRAGRHDAEHDRIREER